MASGLFTSESVSMGHPDKVADQISDGVLDALLAQDPSSRVACETLCTTDLVVLAGEVTTRADLHPARTSQVTVEHVRARPVGISAVAASTQHPDKVEQQKTSEYVISEVIGKTIPKELLNSKTKYHINPTGRFAIGGPHGDTGLT